VLVRVGAIEASWDGFAWAEFAAEARVAMYRIVGWLPVIYPEPRRQWAGAIDWLDRAGVGLDWSAGDADA
jgi:hypothetical protein